MLFFKKALVNIMYVDLISLPHLCIAEYNQEYMDRSVRCDYKSTEEWKCGGRCRHLPLLANSMDLMAVAVDAPLYTLNDLSTCGTQSRVQSVAHRVSPIFPPTSNVVESMMRICSVMIKGIILYRR